MLVHLKISNYAIIENVEISLCAGFNAITGETGAGKSIIVGAAGLLLGGRASADVVRRGADSATIEAVFDISGHPAVKGMLTEHGFSSDDDELIVRRLIASSGRSRIYVNGALCTAAVLARVTGMLFDISGQHEHQALSDRAVQRNLVDAAGVSASDINTMDEAYGQLKHTVTALQGTEIDDRARVERIDYLRFQLGELEAAALQPGEDSELEALHQRLQRASDLQQTATEAEQRLYSDEGAVTDILTACCRRLESLVAVDSALEPHARQLDEARILVEDVAQNLGRYAQAVDLDDARLLEVEQRIDLIHRLKRKHGVTVDELLERVDTMRAEIADLEAIETRRATLEHELQTARDRVATCATKLTKARTKIARKLAQEASTRINALRMPGAQLMINVDPVKPKEDDHEAFVFGNGDDRKRVTPHGWDRIDFVAALNPGETPRPIGRVASGGELSRLMLAIGQVIGAYDPVPTSVFDEVDTGISGAVADVVGAALADVARHRQVLVVTHLPQVAAYANRHFHVGKTGDDNERTTTHVAELSHDDRVEELARMLASSQVTKQARDNAQQLLELAQHNPSTQTKQAR